MSSNNTKQTSVSESCSPESNFRFGQDISNAVTLHSCRPDETQQIVSAAATTVIHNNNRTNSEEEKNVTNVTSSKEDSEKSPEILTSRQRSNRFIHKNINDPANKPKKYSGQIEGRYDLAEKFRFVPREITRTKQPKKSSTNKNHAKKIPIVQRFGPKKFSTLGLEPKPSATSEVKHGVAVYSHLCLYQMYCPCDGSPPYDLYELWASKKGYNGVDVKTDKKLQEIKDKFLIPCSKVLSKPKQFRKKARVLKFLVVFLPIMSLFTITRKSGNQIHKYVINWMLGSIYKAQESPDSLVFFFFAFVFV
jgi:hypothetical protein